MSIAVSKLSCSFLLDGEKKSFLYCTESCENWTRSPWFTFKKKFFFLTVENVQLFPFLSLPPIYSSFNSAGEQGEGGPMLQHGLLLKTCICTGFQGLSLPITLNQNTLCLHVCCLSSSSKLLSCSSPHCRTSNFELTAVHERVLPATPFSFHSLSKFFNSVPQQTKLFFFFPISITSM